MNFKKMLSICKRSKAYFLYDLPDGEQMLSNGSCGYILYGHPEYTPETLRMVADLAEDDSVIMTRMQKADLPLADQCHNEEYAAPLDTCIVAAGAVWQPLVVGASMAFINRRALQPIEKEEEGYDLYRRGDLVVVKSGLIVQGVIRTMDLSKAEAVCRDLINLGTVARALVDVCHDLKTMRDEGLYTELGYDTFEEYAEQACGIKQRQAYSYISAYEKLGQKYMADHADLGITKLELISQISSYEREEFAADVDLESATVRELKAEVERYKKQTEQLTFDLGQAQSELSETPEPVDTDTLRSSIEQEVKAKYSAQLEELQQRADAAPDPEAIRKEAEKEAAKEYKAKLATAKADAEKKPKPLWKNWSRKRQT